MHRVLAALGGVFVALALALPVTAHGDGIVELGAERVRPGETVEVRGDLGSGEAFDVALVSTTDGSRRVIGTIPAIEEGHFQSFVVVPGDMTTGDYVVEVSVAGSGTGEALRVPLAIAGSPVGSEAGGGPDQAEGRIEPPPSASGARTPSEAAAAPSVGLAASVSGTGDSSATGGDAFVAMIGLAVAAGLVIGSLRVIRRHRA